MSRPFSLILGGTKGLGRCLAIESLRRGITPLITGRTTDVAMEDPELADALFRKLDLSDPEVVNSAARMYEFLGRGDMVPPFSYVFWNAGIFLRKPLTDCTAEEIARMTAVHFTGPLAVLAAVHRVQKTINPLLANAPGAPYHLVTVASTSSWKLRENETVYCALKAAKAHFTRNFAVELLRDLPGSKVTLVNPGGIATPDFWKDAGQDTSRFMDPEELARFIWKYVGTQRSGYSELQIPRTRDGDLNPLVGGIPPEQPGI
ncbi:SDR family NAD(P)-dependent oxidoreductase [Patescibacteria group bacterium]